MAELQLVDTSAWIEYFRSDGDAGVRALVERAVRTESAAWCELIRLELMRGSARQRERVNLIFTTFPRLSIAEDCWRESYAVASAVSKAGSPVPNTDILIHSCAARHGATVLHCDRHFETLADLRL